MDASCLFRLQFHFIVSGKPGVHPTNSIRPERINGGMEIFGVDGDICAKRFAAPRWGACVFFWSPPGVCNPGLFSTAPSGGEWLPASGRGQRQILRLRLRMTGIRPLHYPSCDVWSIGVAAWRLMKSTSPAIPIASITNMAVGTDPEI
jgi:hypothetical protein